MARHPTGPLKEYSTRDILLERTSQFDSRCCASVAFWGPCYPPGNWTANHEKAFLGLKGETSSRRSLLLLFDESSGHSSLHFESGPTVDDHTQDILGWRVDFTPRTLSLVLSLLEHFLARNPDDWPEITDFWQVGLSTLAPELLWEASKHSVPVSASVVRRRTTCSGPLASDQACKVYLRQGLRVILLSWTSWFQKQTPN